MLLVMWKAICSLFFIQWDSATDIFGNSIRMVELLVVGVPVLKK